MKIDIIETIEDLRRSHERAISKVAGKSGGDNAIAARIFQYRIAALDRIADAVTSYHKGSLIARHHPDLASYLEDIKTEVALLFSDATAESVTEPQANNSSTHETKN